MTSLARTGYGMFDSDGDGQSGRHAFSEDAVLTPIFHALTRGRSRGRRPEPAPLGPVDAVETFRRNPLTAPMPVQPLEAAPSRADRRSRGRHHRRLEAVS